MKNERVPKVSDSGFVQEYLYYIEDDYYHDEIRQIKSSDTKEDVERGVYVVDIL